MKLEGHKNIWLLLEKGADPEECQECIATLHIFTCNSEDIPFPMFNVSPSFSQKSHDGVRGTLPRAVPQAIILNLMTITHD